MAEIYIVGFGAHHPEHVITNRDLEATLETTDAWIVSRTGITERRRVADGEHTSDMAAAATQRALADAGWMPEDLDLIICATSSPDTMLPSAASHIANALSSDAVAFDVNAACAGFAYGMATAQSMMVAMGYERVALCSADVYTRFVDYGDRRTAVLFGDGAATVLLQKERPRRGARVDDVLLANWHGGLDLVYVPVGGTWRMDGHRVMGPALDMMVDAAKRVLARNDLTISGLKAFMGHQANHRILEGLASALGIAEDQHWHNVSTMGNHGAAGVVTTLCEGIEQHAGDLRAGDAILMTMVGAGFASGCVLLRWVDSGA